MDYLSKLYKNRTPVLIINWILVALLAGCSHQPVLYLAGDSTMADKEKLYLPERGWGQLLPELFNGNIIIENHAKNGRSTRSFIYEGRWDSLINKVQPGDFVIIQFGHNDGSQHKTERYATPVEYAYNLKRFVNDVRQKKATAILATPVVRRKFDENNLFEDSHGEYPGIMRKVAGEMNVPLLEMHQKSMQLVTQLGSEESKKLYLHYQPGQFDSLPNGITDDTHFSPEGALTIAQIAAGEIRTKVPELAKYLKP